MQEGINQNLVFVDEAGFNLYTRRTRGRAARGERAVRQVAGNRGPNLNIILAISPAVGTVYHELHVNVLHNKASGNVAHRMSVPIGTDLLLLMSHWDYPITY